MNKIFKTKRNSRGQSVVCSEIAKSNSKGRIIGAVPALAAALMTISADASLVRGDIDYNYFRNFAENKGQFQAGAVNIPIYDKTGKFLGTALPKDIPMPDFSAVDSTRYLSGLIDYQRVASVKHNSNNHFNGLTFGDKADGFGKYRYRLVNRHDHSTLDYNTPRLNKMVIEVESAELPEDFKAEDLTNGRFTAFARIGSGTQGVQDGNNIEITHNAYLFATGGTALKFLGNKGDMVTTVIGDVQDNETGGGPLVSYGTKGDSGSPLYGYDPKLGRWLLVGNIAQFYGYETAKNNYMITQRNFIQEGRVKDAAGIVNAQSAKPVRWEDLGGGESRITSELSSFDVA
ncbi:S6 family peptidase, partial [Moraxella sp. ZJ142]